MNRLDLKAVAAALAILAGGFGFGARVTAPTKVEGGIGALVAIRLQIDGAGTVRATAADGLTMLGVVDDPEHPGFKLATVLISADAHAGGHDVTFQLVDGGRTLATAKTEIDVARKAGVRVAIVDPGPILAGASTTIPVHVTNTGNDTDTFGLATVSVDQAILSAPSVTLDAGASENVTVTLTPRRFGLHIVEVDARSQADPSVSQNALMKYQVLAFGASNPNAPALSYALPLGASYGSQGFSYFGAVTLNGALSSVVSTTDSFAVAPGSRTASIGAYGDNWSALYGYDRESGHSLTLSYDGATLSASLDTTGGLTTGAGYRTGPWSVSYAHRWGPLASDTMTGGYTFSVLPDLTLTPSIGAIGEVHGDGTYHVSPLAALGATWSTSAVIVQAQARVAPWSSQPWSASLLGYSRQAVPFGVSGSATASPDGYTASASFTETPSDRLTLSQQVDYASDGTIGTQFGVQLDLARQPVQLVAVATSTASPGSWTASASFTANITQLPWLATASINVGPVVSVAYGQSYIGPAFAAGGSISVPLSSTFAPLVGVRAAYATQSYSLGAGASYDASNGDIGVSGSLGVQVLPTLALQTSAGYDRLKGFTWSVGAQATLFGGFAVPTPVVNAFGGLDVGTVTGILIRETDQGRRAAAGVTVGVARLGRYVKTDAEGRYSLSVPPGNYQLSFPDLPPQYTLPSDTSVTVRRQATVRRDLTLKVSYAISGQVYVDVDHRGKPTANAYGLTGVTLHLTGANGDTKATTTNRGGNFVFRDLRPGTFEITVLPSGLPPSLRVPSKPETVKLGPNGLAFVSIGVTPVRTTVTNTLGGGTLSLSLDVQPSQAPPGALVHVVARARQASRVEAALGSAPPVDLASTANGTFEGDVEMPADAAGVALLKVTASANGAHAEQTTMVFVTNGPLAILTLDPGYVETGATVTLSLDLLVQPTDLVVQVGDRTVPMTAVGRRQFEGTFDAPGQPGTLPVTVHVNGKELAQQVLTVVKP